MGKILRIISSSLGMEMQQVGTEVQQGQGFISSWFTRMYSWAWKASYKINNQPVCE